VDDWARVTRDTEMLALIEAKARAFYGSDTNCPLAYEPSGEDFLSPCLAEADLMRRILPAREYGAWLRNFLPLIPSGTKKPWLAPAEVTDRSDPKLAHLDGLNLSRSWMLLGIASGLPHSAQPCAGRPAAAEAAAG
jgi:Protein of unknown function (DUF2891)